MSTSIGRAAQNGIITSQMRVADAGKRNFLKNGFDDDDDDDDNGGYRIDPSVQMWKTIAIPRSKSKQDLKDDMNSSNQSMSMTGGGTPLRKPSFNRNSNSDSGEKGVRPAPMLQSSSTTALGGDKTQITQQLDSTSKELDDLHRALDELQFDKREADRKKGDVKIGRSTSEGDSSELNHVDISNLTNELLKQQKEFQAMMEAIQREKKELVLQAQALAVEKKQQELKEEQMKVRAEEEMKVQIEVMKMQNQMLMNRLEKSQQEHMAMVEQERKEREIAVAKMESENQKLTQKIIDAQSKAEQDLAKERDDMRTTLRKMETEKFELLERIQATENKSREEAGVLEAQRLQFQESLQKMEGEKNQLDARISENEIKSKLATEEVAKQLAAEKEKLLEKIITMEKEKERLADNLNETEKKAKDMADSLAQQLAVERKELQDRIENMEKEKKDLAMHFAITEKISQQETQQIVDQLEHDKIEIQGSMEKKDIEKMNIENKLMSNLANLAMSPDGEEFIKEREMLQQKYDAINNDKLMLQEKLRLAEEALLVRDKLVEEKAQKEKEELRQTVLRMKEEVHAERQHEHSKSSSALKSLKSSKSLLDTIANNESESAPSPLISQGEPHTIGTIQEEDEKEEKSEKIPAKNSRQEEKASPNKYGDVYAGEKSFMDDDDEEPEAEDPADLFPDLPAPHAAAACGDFKRLIELSSIEPSLLSSFDDARRSPLFYAVAYGKEKITTFLLNKCPDTAMVPDEHGDFPLHAAVSAGNSSCVELLIKATNGLVTVKNSMDMTPVHLTCNVDCLDTLYKYGADIAALDCNGRSPLFVACAMNRDDIVEYLINALDQEGTFEQCLAQKDNRGDTCLHAAACNGSVDCLLLLLQYGVDPTVLNAAGLKAIDLAIKNKQKKCRELLAEYSLHFFTSSDFDSVLFWATLEGHKLVKQRAEDISSSANYDIIKKHPSMAHMANPNASFSLQGGKSGGQGGLNRNQSLFSMKNQSLRLQKWGNWIAYNDKATSKMYWYNSETSTGQWETPSEVLSLQQAAIADTSSSSSSSSSSSTSSPSKLNSHKALTAKLSMRLKRVGEWIEYRTESGVPFYYHEKTAEFQWSPPDHSLSQKSNKLKAEKAKQGTEGGVGSDNATNSSVTNNNNNSSNSNINSHNNSVEAIPPQKASPKPHAATSLSEHYKNPFEDSTPSINSQNDGNATTAAAAAEERDKSEGETSHNDSKQSLNFGDWRPFIDETGQMYWYNQATRESQWETPFEVQNAIDNNTSSTSKARKNVAVYSDEHDHDAAQIDDVDDLFN